jgi:CBS domain-containing protein
LIQDHVLTGGEYCFLVTDSQNSQGVITLDDVRAVTRTERGTVTTGQIMTPVDSTVAANADDDVWSLVRRMGEEGRNALPVVDNGRFLGLLTRENLLSHIRLRSELAA